MPRSPVTRLLGTTAENRTPSPGSILYVQSELVREPRLMALRQKPTGRVRVDTSHPLFKNLRFLYMPQGGPINLAWVGEIPVLGAITGTDIYSLIDREPTAYCNTKNGASYIGPFNIKAVGNSGWIFAWKGRTLDAGTTPRVWGTGTTPNGFWWNCSGSAPVKVRFQAGGSANTAWSAEGTTAASLSDPVVAYAYREPGNSSCYVGILGGDSIGTDTSGYPSLDQTAVALLNDGVNSTSHKGFISWAIILADLANPAAVLNDVINNPAQFLIPA